MPVAVGLDHGHYCRARTLAQRGDVRADRAEVNGYPGRIVGHEESVPGFARISRTAAGTAFATASAVMGPPWLASAAARPCTSEAVAANSAMTSEALDRKSTRLNSSHVAMS